MKRILLYVWILALLSGCTRPAESPQAAPWHYADLLAVLPPASGSSTPPSQDLAAVYARRTGSDQQIRVDLLDFDVRFDFDLYLALDTRPGGTTSLPIDAESELEWDLLMRLPSLGTVDFYGSQAELLAPEEWRELRLRVNRDPFLDSIVITFDPRGMHARQANVRLEVLVTAAHSPAVTDRAGPYPIWTDSTGPRPPQAKALLAFWNTFPAATPAQALRRWNGAHSGPDSQRHGLSSLVNAVAETRLPALLLDLKSPSALSALDYSGGLKPVKALAVRGLLTLPDPVVVSTTEPGHPFPPPTWVSERSLQESKGRAQEFGFSPSLFLFTRQEAGSLEILPGEKRYSFIFTAGVPSALACCHVERMGNTYISQLPLEAASSEETSTQQATPSGLSVEMRRMLLEQALSPDPGSSSFVLLGGSLSDTTWGEPARSLNTLRWINAHPWIQVLSASELLERSRKASLSQMLPNSGPDETTPGDNPGEPPSTGMDTAFIHSRLLEALMAAPPGRVVDLSWQAYYDLWAPVTPTLPNLSSLRAAYLGQIGHLLAAADWEANPPNTSRVNCSQDIDWDNEVECQLASHDFFAVFEIKGGFMTYSFYRTASGVHQWTGPSSQFMVGVGDPSTWRLDQGAAADPGQLRGAFSEVRAGFSNPSWEPYSVQTDLQEIRLTSPDGSVEKTFQLAQDGLRIMFITAYPVNVQVPIVIDPWLRFEPGWVDQYRGCQTQTGWMWGAAGAIDVGINSQTALSARTFRDTLELMARPEDPNLNYPPGHFLPFPMALLELGGEGQFEITINFGDRATAETRLFEVCPSP